MKRLILCLAGFLVVFGPIAASLINPLPVAAATTATSYCSSHGYTQGGRDAPTFAACTDGYSGAQANKSLQASCPTSLGGYPGSYTDPEDASPFSVCLGVYSDNKSAPTPAAPKSPSSAAQKACESTEQGSNPSIAACEIGYDGAKKDVGTACAGLGPGSKTIGSAADCEVGWDLANNITPPGDGPRTPPSSAAASACASYTSGTSAYNACTAGYAAQGAGTSEASACSSTKYPDSNDVTACKTGWEQAQSDAAADASKPLGCTAQFTDPLTWILCPIVDVLAQIVNFVDNLITNQLNVKTNAIFCSSQTCNAYYAAWESFRDIALGLMTIVGLVLIISQALGLEILDAYTIRKTLPRLLIAAIAITLSWPLMQFAIQLSDDLGFGVRHLIYAPFAQLGDSIDLSFGGGIGNLFGSVAAAGGAIAAVPLWIVAGGPAALLAYVGTAALAVGVAILVLILRQIAIILLMLLSPLALVAYILPNTQRVFRMWWESFSRALLMFPLIAAFIATGRVFSAIAIHNGGAVNQLIGFAAYFAPYFMIPLTFRMAGSAVGAMGNFVNSRAQGGFESLRKARTDSRQARTKAAQKNGLYRSGLVPFKRPFAKDEHGNAKKTSLGKVLNTIGNQTVDWKDGWRLQAAKRGGKVGEAVFGRQVRGLKSHIGSQQIEHTAAAAKELQLTYHTGRALAGQHQYVYDSLKGKKMKDGTDAQQALRDNFGIGQRDENGHLSEANLQGWRGSENEKEHNQLASIYDYGSQGARIAAGELRAKGREIDDLKGAGKDETQRADTEFMGMMVSAQAGRLENKELAGYYNNMVQEGEPEEAMKRLERLQELAAPLRTSQKRNYGLEFRVNPDTGMQEAIDVYDDPTGAAAQKSVGRATSQDISNSKSEDLKTEDGHLSGWSEALVASASETVRDTRKVTDPVTGKTRMVAYDTGKAKTGQALRDARAAQAKIQSIEGYASGDIGVGGQIFKIMQEAGIEPKYGGDPKGTLKIGSSADNVSSGGVILPSGISTEVQHEQLRPQEQPPQEPPENPFNPGS